MAAAFSTAVEGPTASTRRLPEASSASPRWTDTPAQASSISLTTRPPPCPNIHVAPAAGRRSAACACRCCRSLSACCTAPALPKRSAVGVRPPTFNRNWTPPLSRSMSRARLPPRSARLRATRSGSSRRSVWREAKRSAAAAVSEGRPRMWARRPSFETRTRSDAPLASARLRQAWTRSGRPPGTGTCKERRPTCCAKMSSISFDPEPTSDSTGSASSPQGRRRQARSLPLFGSTTGRRLLGTCALGSCITYCSPEHAQAKLTSTA
mmetsp:Transcript_41492/g.133934  ORF Transcript_41492/g.133934 Transcript_41492/m.133934 type:complete len:266 (+) Transcript_41492:896-1693(+)